MNIRLPILSGRKVVKALGKVGYTVVGSTVHGSTVHGYTVHDQKGSHIHLRHLIKKPLTVQNHKRDRTWDIKNYHQGC